MEKIKIVARYMNGQTVKGYTQDFAPTKPDFHLFREENNTAAKGLEIFLRELKAIFFVKDFAGNPKYKEDKQFKPEDRPAGRIIEVTFEDGEVMVGNTVGYDPKRPGFFVFPADSGANNIKIFAISKAVRGVRYLK
jgi:hypothetical protein